MLGVLSHVNRSREAFVGGSILHTGHNWEDMQTLDTVLFVFMKYSRLHSGGGTPGYVAEFPSTAAVHVVVGSPISSKPGLQV